MSKRIDDVILCAVDSAVKADRVDAQIDPQIVHDITLPSDGDHIPNLDGIRKRFYTTFVSSHTRIARAFSQAVEHE